jgi:hypothetical protein
LKNFSDTPQYSVINTYKDIIKLFPEDKWIAMFYEEWDMFWIQLPMWRWIIIKPTTRTITTVWSF